LEKKRKITKENRPYIRIQRLIKIVCTTFIVPVARAISVY